MSNSIKDGRLTINEEILQSLILNLNSATEGRV